MISPPIYDVFISYRWVEPDKDWVRRHLHPALQKAGLKVCLDVCDFVPGRNLILEMTRAGRESKFAVCVLSADYFEGNRFVQFEALMLRSDDPAGLESRLIPLILRPCSIPAWLRGLIPIDWTGETQLEREWRKLLAVLEAPNQTVGHPPRLGLEGNEESIKSQIGVFDVEESSRLVSLAKNSTKTPSILRYLKECLQAKEDPTERYWVYVTAGEIGGSDAILLLQGGVLDVNPFAKEGAQDALKKLKSKQ